MDELPLEGHPYVLGPLLGHGAFGSVYQCEVRRTHELCALKVIRKSEFNSNVDSVFREVNIVSSLQHPHIVEFRSALELEEFILIEMELMAGGTLKQRIDAGRLSDGECARVMREVLTAVCYLHERDIVHRDLKPDNVLFKTPAADSIVKVTDFGLSAKFEDAFWSKSLTGCSGTLGFMAPEQASSKHYSRPVDIWSCGIILYMLLAGQHPLFVPEDNAQSFLAKLQAPAWAFPQDFPPLAKDLFMRMVAYHPLDRYTAAEALRHPWVTRADGAIPRTYIERMNDYNSRSRLLCLFMKGCALGVVIAPVNKYVAKVYRDKLEEAQRPKAKPKIVVLQAKEEKPPKTRVLSMDKKSSPSPSPSARQTRKSLLVTSSTYARLGISPIQSPVKTRVSSPSPNSTRSPRHFFA